MDDIGAVCVASEQRVNFDSTVKHDEYVEPVNAMHLRGIDPQTARTGKPGIDLYLQNGLYSVRAQTDNEGNYRGLDGNDNRRMYNRLVEECTSLARHLK